MSIFIVLFRIIIGQTDINQDRNKSHPRCNKAFLQNDNLLEERFKDSTASFSSFFMLKQTYKMFHLR